MPFLIAAFILVVGGIVAIATNFWYIVLVLGLVAAAVPCYLKWPVQSFLVCIALFLVGSCYLAAMANVQYENSRAEVFASNPDYKRVVSISIYSDGRQVYNINDSRIGDLRKAIATAESGSDISFEVPKGWDLSVFKTKHKMFKTERFAGDLIVHACENEQLELTAPDYDVYIKLYSYERALS